MPRPGAQPRRPRARVGAAARGRRASATATTSTSSPTASVPDAYERTLPEVFPDFAPGSFTWDDDLRRLGVDDLQRLPVGRQLVQPRRAASSTPTIVLLPGQPRRRGAAAGRDRVHLEAAGHQLPEPARGARHHPGAARAWPGSPAPPSLFKAEAIVGPQRPGALPRPGRAPRQGQRPRLPQQPDGADLVDAGQRRRAAGGARPAVPAAGAVRRRAWITYAALPRRHRLGHRRRRRRGGRARRLRAPAVPVRLVRRRVPRLARPAGWSSRRTRPPATAGSAARAAVAGRPGGGARPVRQRRRQAWTGCSWPTPWSSAGAASR